jgi:hypothetical protein
MITQTLTGVVYSSIATSQSAQYVRKANSYMSDLRNEKLQHEHTAALAQHMSEETSKGKEFADAAAEDMNWYDPPRGHIIDEWA